MSEHTLHWRTGGGVRGQGISSPPGFTLLDTEDGLEAGVRLSAPPKKRKKRERERGITNDATKIHSTGTMQATAQVNG